MPGAAPTPIPPSPRGLAARCIGLFALALAAWALAGTATAQLGLSPAGTNPTVSLEAPGIAAPEAQLIELIPVLTGEGTPESRKGAAAAILRMATEDSTAALIRILSLKNNVGAKIAICQAVSEFDDPPPTLSQPLFTLLEERDAALREAAVAALSAIRDPDTIARLRAFMERQQAEWLRAEHVLRTKELYALLTRDADRTAHLLSWLRAPLTLDRLIALDIIHAAMLATTPVPPADEVLQQLRQMLRDPEESVRRKLVIVLRDLQEAEDVARLRAMIDVERSPLVLAEIYLALGRMGDIESIPACIAGLGHRSEAVVMGAADAFGRLARRTNGKRPQSVDAAVAALLKRASQPIENPNLRRELIEAMAEIADESFLPILVSRAQQDEPVAAIRQAALIGIGRIGKPEQLELLNERLAEDVDPGVRQAAAEAIGKLGTSLGHLRPLMIRLDAKIEPSVAVQAAAWDAYRAVFVRLPAADRQSALANWAGDDLGTATRRADLLADLEKQLATGKTEPQIITAVREQLGDTYLLIGQHAQAAAAYSRALDVVKLDQTDSRSRLLAKQVEAHLLTPAIDKAVSMAASAQSAPDRRAMAERFLRHVETLGRTDPKAAKEVIARLQAAVPGLFGPEYATRFDAIRRTATQPATTPANLSTGLPIRRVDRVQ